MRDQDGILSLQDGSWRPKIDLCRHFLVNKGRLRKGSEAFTEPMGEYEGDPQSTINHQVLIQNYRLGADGFSSLREDRRPLDQGVRKMEGAGWREPMDWSTVSFRSVFGSFLIDF